MQPLWTAFVVLLSPVSSKSQCIANPVAYAVAYAVAYYNQNTQPLKTESLFSLYFSNKQSLMQLKKFRNMQRIE